MARQSGGSALKDHLQRIAANLAKASTVEAGFMEDATYPDGTSVASVAADNEWGTTRTVEGENGETTKVQHAPPRPFFRGAISRNQAKWPVNLSAALKANDYDSEIALGLVGQEIQEEVQQSIIDFDDPPNAPATIARKGFDDPLIDSSVMLNSVSHRVK